MATVYLAKNLKHSPNVALRKSKHENEVAGHELACIFNLAIP